VTLHQLRTPQEAAQWLQGLVKGRLSTDSRKTGQGDGFIAWPGAAKDGRAFVPKALEQGAAACLVDAQGLEAFAFDDERIAVYQGLKAASGPVAAAYYGQPSQQLDVLAITGTNGKTSTAWWLAQALSAAGRPCGMIGTLGVGRVTGEVVGTGLTTPDPVLLQQTLRRFVDEGLGACAVEASSIGIVERHLDGTRIRVALFTNFTQDHLDYHGSRAAYWQAKAELFDWPGLEAAVINIDDAQGLELAKALKGRPGLEVWTVALNADARLQARNIRMGAQGLRFDVVEGASSGIQALTLQAQTLGNYNVSNLLGVIAALRALGFALDVAVAACSQLRPVPGRMEFQGLEGEPLAVVDYAHTPDALIKILQALRPLAEERGGKLHCVFGCGGDRDPVKRPLMGAAAAQYADAVLITSDNPRSEAPEAIIAQIEKGLPANFKALVEPDRAKAVAMALAMADAQDVVLIAGKGHEDYQEIKGVRKPFSDREQVDKALAQRKRKVSA
jgi:UDP-N-acetylmuramoyl-L-alanyl-D-glutamate--2,6-diaminopimelate ligase